MRGIQQRIFLFTGLIAAGMALAYTLFGFFSARELAYARLDARLQAAANSYAYLINVQEQEQVLAKGKDSDAALRQKNDFLLTDFAQKQGLAYIYSMVQASDGIRYIYSSVTQDEYKDHSKYKSLFLQPYDEEEPKAKIRQVFASGKIDYLEYSSQYGQFRTLYVPASMPSGQPYLIAVDIDSSEVNSAILAVLLQNAGIGIALFVFALLVANVLSKTLTRQLIGTGQALESLACGEGDLTVRLPVLSEDEVGRIASAFNLFVGHLAQMMQKVHVNALQLREQAALGHQAADEIGQISLKQTDAVRGSSAAIQQLSVSIEEIASQVDEAVQDTRTALTSSNEATEQIDLASRELAQLKAMINTLAQTIRKLDERSSHIDMVTQVIREVAEQTNLLALNAAIEAARAGEHGRGFAIVADEVRKLAERTSGSSREITSVVEAIQQDSKQTLLQLEQAVKSVETGASATDTADQIIHTIRDFMHAFTNRIDLINHATREQTASSTQIAQTMEQISSGSEQTQSNVRYMIAIDDLAIELQGVVSGFKIT